MGRGRANRKRRNRRARLLAVARSISARRLVLTLEAVEMARGHDGPLRGAPEPCLVVGAFFAGGGRAVTIGRNLTRWTAPDGYPARLELGRELMRTRAHLGGQADGGAFVLLAFALEEDGEQDVQSLYADLEHPERFAVWDAHSAVVELHSLEELANLPPSVPPKAESVRVLRRGVDLTASVTNDDFVGSLLIRVGHQPESRVTEWRFRFRSSDGRNDWTAIMLVSVS